MSKKRLTTHDSRFTTLKNVIAIDGPVGVGKSTVARLAAKKLGFLFVNTGDMYRALTWKALAEGVDINDKTKVARFLKNRLRWKFKNEGGILKVFIDGRERSRELRSEKISRATPTIAQIPEVRKILRKIQRNFARRGNVVLEGRDTTTDVAPDAFLKVYLNASVNERARRRFEQLKNEGKKVKLSSIGEALALRDRREKKRKIMPGFTTKGTQILDTTQLSLEETVKKILKLYARKGSS